MDLEASEINVGSLQLVSPFYSLILAFPIKTDLDILCRGRQQNSKDVNKLPPHRYIRHLNSLLKQAK